MKRVLGISICLAEMLARSAHGFSSDGSSLSRNFDRTVASTNTPIVVTVTFTNAGTNDLRGWVYSEEIPSGMSLTPLGVTLNGKAVSNFAFESGQEGEVYPLTIPCRWTLELPTQFAESNPIPAAAIVQIKYALTSAIPGTFILKEFSWAAFRPVSTNAEFGYSENTQQQTLSISQGGVVLLTKIKNTAAGFSFTLTGLPGVTYRIESSGNLFDWFPLSTNTAPFDFTDTRSPALSQSFYRAVSLP